jgi:hypothetical protein
MPGLIRTSFGLYNTVEEIDDLVEALVCIADGKYRGHYRQNIASGEYIPDDWAPAFNQYFQL